ncbi:MAG: winged helix-turn-helix domain-containing protein [Phormidesmis sp.]
MNSATVVSTVDRQAQIEELKTFISRERDGRQVKKALAVKLLYQGHTYESVIRILDVSMGSVSTWKQAYEGSGLGGFKPNHKGRKSYLEAAEKTAVVSWLQQQEIWTLGELEYHLASEYDVTYESSQSYYDLFAAAGYSWKKTSKVNPKADPEVVAAKKLRSSGCWHATAKR